MHDGNPKMLRTVLCCTGYQLIGTESGEADRNRAYRTYKYQFVTTFTGEAIHRWIVNFYQVTYGKS